MSELASKEVVVNPTGSVATVTWAVVEWRPHTKIMRPTFQKKAKRNRLDECTFGSARDVNGRPERGKDIYASWERVSTSGQSGGIDFARKGPPGYKGLQCGCDLVNVGERGIRSIFPED